MPRTSKRLPEDDFYRELGRNLRVVRSAAGKSQGEIAAHLGVTFQQVQKYENGTNRIPVDSLVKLAAYLEVPLLQLIAPSDRDSEFQTLAEQFGAKEFRALIKAWGIIKDRPLRAALLNLVKHMAEVTF
jgi:transcriptional regulator with XRE-family HTH domain